MNKSKKWSDEKNVLILSMIFESEKLKYLRDTPFITEIKNTLNNKFPDFAYAELDILWQLFHLSNINNKLSKDQRFIGCPMPKGFKVYRENPQIEIKEENKKRGCLFTLMEIDKASNLYPNVEINYDIGFSIQSNIEKLSNELNISKLEASFLFVKNNDLTYEEGSNNLTLHKNHTINISNNNVSISMNNTNLNQKKLNDLMIKTSEAFNHDSEYNLLPFNDPTGTGKTHAVVSQFIQKYYNVFPALDSKEKIINKRKNLFFIAPLKNQLAPDNLIYQLAENNNVPLLFLRSLKDLSDLETKFLLKDQSKNSLAYMKTKDFWSFLFSLFDRKIIEKIDRELKKLKEKNIMIDEEDEDYETIIQNYKIPQLNKLKSAYDTYINFEINHGLLKVSSVDEYNEELEKAELLFRSEMQSLAKLLAISVSDKDLQEIYNTNALYVGKTKIDKLKLFDRFGINKHLYALTYYLLMFVLPIEVAKFVNCVIYITGAKSQTKINFIAQAKRKDKKTPLMLDLEEIVSGFTLSKKADFLKYATSNNFEECIEGEMFEKMSSNYFVDNEIGSSVIYDEEHILHNTFTHENTYKTITERFEDSKVNILHAIIGMSRWYQNSCVKSLVNNYEGVVEEKNALSKNFYKTLKDHTVFQTDQEIDDFFEMIENNAYGFFIKIEEFQFIKSLCQNVLSFSPKKIQSKEFIESISLVLMKQAREILLTKNKQDYPENSIKYNVFDFFQICLCLMHVLKESSKDLRDELRKNRNDNNQNLAISHLANISFNNKNFLHNLFSSSLNLKDTDPLNIQFTYFLTKIGFHFDFPEKIMKNEYSPDSIAVEPQVFILKELPEVDILKILHNPLNRVFLLSATRGFENIYAGNFSMNFFHEINQYVPNKIRIYDRRQDPNDCLAELIEERASFRRINVGHLVFDNKYNHLTKNALNDEVNEVLYPVSDVSVKNLTDISNFKSISSKYDLIKNKSFNNSKPWVSKFKKTDTFKSLYNIYSRDELINVLNSIVHTVEKDKNAMILSLSNKFYKYLIQDESVLKEVFGQCKKIGPEGQEGKILEISIDSSKKLKLICYDSGLSKIVNLDDAFILEPNQITVIVSSFISAGTGLNFTLQNNLVNISKDFDSLYFANASFYTSIKGDDGFNTWSNQLLIMKNYTHKGNKCIKDLEDGISSNEGFITLETEHLMEQVKVYMQSIGRVERRNTQIDTTIYFVDGSRIPLFKNVMSLFNNTMEKHRNNYEETIIANFSMLAKAVLKTSQGYIGNISLTTKERNILESVSHNDFNTYNNFFCSSKGFNFLLSEYRNLNPDFYWVKEFNEVFRNYISPNYNFQQNLEHFIIKYMQVLKKTGFDKQLLSLVKTSEFNFTKNKVAVGKEIALNFIAHVYTDISKHNNIVSDGYFFNYFNNTRFDLDKSVFLQKIMTNYSSFQNSELSRLPNMYLYHLIKGNLGEKILEEYFKEKNIIFNDIENMFSKNAAQKVYELFDFYVIKDKKIYCIDTKNWRMYQDGAALKTLMRLPDKIKRISQIKEFQGYTFEYIYLNMFPEANSEHSKGMNSLLGNYKDARFINFLENEVLQNEVYKVTKKSKKLMHYKREEGNLKISTEWRKTL